MIKCPYDSEFLLLILENNECIPESYFINPENPENLDLEREIEVLSCPICTGIYQNPVSDNCDPPHTFGKDCIDRCLKIKKECPMSRTVLHNEDLRRIPGNFTFFIQKLQINCLFQYLGCKWKGELSTLKEHSMKSCEFSHEIKIILEGNFFSDLAKMNPKRLKILKIIQKEVDDIFYPLRTNDELYLLPKFSNISELNISFLYHSFENLKELAILGKSLGKLFFLKKLNLSLCNQYAFCHSNSVNLTYWFNIEKTEVKISQLIKWNAINSDELNNLFCDVFDNCKELKYINLDFSFNQITASGIEKLIHKMHNAKKLDEIFLNFSNQKQFLFKIHEKINDKYLAECFTNINLNKNIGFFFFSKKTVKEESNNILGHKLKKFLISEI